jgi:hypothetical protein
MTPTRKKEIEREVTALCLTYHSRLGEHKLAIEELEARLIKWLPSIVETHNKEELDYIIEYTKKITKKWMGTP